MADVHVVYMNHLEKIRQLNTLLWRCLEQFDPKNLNKPDPYGLACEIGEVVGCKQCGGQRLAFQVYCGAACVAQAGA